MFLTTNEITPIAYPLAAAGRRKNATQISIATGRGIAGAGRSREGCGDQERDHLEGAHAIAERHKTRHTHTHALPHRALRSVQSSSGTSPYFPLSADPESPVSSLIYALVVNATVVRIVSSPNRNRLTAHGVVLLRTRHTPAQALKHATAYHQRQMRATTGARRSGMTPQSARPIG